jgi:hypothetical protein
MQFVTGEEHCKDAVRLKGFHAAEVYPEHGVPVGGFPVNRREIIIIK